MCCVSVVFKVFDAYHTGAFTHDEMFHVYKTLFDRAVSDDHILDLTCKSLRHPDLATHGEITKEEFIKVKSEKQKLTGRKEGNVLFNDTLNTFYLWLYGITHGLLFPISSKDSFICIIPQTG